MPVFPIVVGDIKFKIHFLKSFIYMGLQKLLFIIESILDFLGENLCYIITAAYKKLEKKKTFFVNFHYCK